jgi:hypothetical protein
MSHTDDHGGTDREINLKLIVYLVVGLVVVTVLTFGGMAAMVRSMERSVEAGDPLPSAMPEAREKWVPPGPRLQEFPPTADIEALHAREDEQLTTFAWVDEEAGVVRIPVDLAVEVLARRGLPAHDQVDALSAELFGGAARADAGPSEAGREAP